MSTGKELLLAEIEMRMRDCEEAQRMILHGRKTILGKFQPVVAYLNHKQHEYDIKRIQLEAAKKYLTETSK